MTETHTPKLFVSYCWSNPEHENWVVKLATSLRESGVDVILDKWDLKEGHDANAFMEKMVTDPTITKVAIISDETYAKRADERTGGVGTETQIISQRIYSSVNQDKFVVVIPHKDHEGKPFLPAYYSGRIFIDLSQLSDYQENFEKLLRWIFNKPLHVKPPLGSTPTFLNEKDAISTGTGTLQRRTVDAIQTGKVYVNGAISEYFDALARSFESFRISLANPETVPYAVVIESIESFDQTKKEYLQVIKSIALYHPTSSAVSNIHRFFENIFSYMYAPSNASVVREWEQDNFRFIIHEIFVTTIAYLIKYEHFDLADYLISTPYYIQYYGRTRRSQTVPFTAFRCPTGSLTEYSRQKQRLSYRSDFLIKRTDGQEINEIRFYAGGVPALHSQPRVRRSNYLVARVFVIRH
ncbi:TIR domain-containing protein [Ochrobactrum sp. SSR]|uniref:SEFIR domain-containing protein n=1 Tax=Ochrobactrum sp. SSR TaxID=3045176 RepID=UPI00279EB7F5|nr:TIR domain-containing protein [Ochrobactrum sp. SSR]